MHWQSHSRSDEDLGLDIRSGFRVCKLCSIHYPDCGTIERVEIGLGDVGLVVSLEDRLDELNRFRNHRLRDGCLHGDY